MPLATFEERKLAPAIQPAEIESLLACGPPSPYASFAGLAPDQTLRRFTLSTALQTIERNARDARCGATRWLRADEGLSALISWGCQDWDSEQFGFPAARLDLLLASGSYRTARRAKSILTAETLAECRDAGIRHIIMRADAGDLSSIHALEENRFEVIDGINTFVLRLPGKPPHGEPVSEEGGSRIRVGLFEHSHLDGILAIARESYLCDRFHADASLPGGVADRIHESWMRNSCLHGGADAVFVATVNDRVAGYVTVRLDHTAGRSLGIRLATIVLVATASRAQGAGVARTATQYAVAWCQSQGVAAVQVGTQLRNIAAARLYETCGFRLAGASLTLRHFDSGAHA